MCNTTHITHFHISSLLLTASSHHLSPYLLIEWYKYETMGFHAAYASRSHICIRMTYIIITTFLLSGHQYCHRVETILQNYVILLDFEQFTLFVSDLTKIMGGHFYNLLLPNLGT